jgi:hypothetical protein
MGIIWREDAGGTILDLQQQRTQGHEHAFQKQHCNSTSARGSKSPVDLVQLSCFGTCRSQTLLHVLLTRRVLQTTLPALIAQ